MHVARGLLLSCFLLHACGGSRSPSSDNHPPLAADAAFTLDEDGTLVITTAELLAGASDADGDALTLVTPLGLELEGTLTDAGDGSFTYTPPLTAQALLAGGSLTEAFDFSVSDGQASSEPATVTLTILGVNDAPVVTGESLTASASAPVVVPWRANDTDADSPLGLESLDLGAQPGAVHDNQDGTFTYDPQGSFDALASGESAVVVIAYVVTDDTGLTGSATATLTLTGVNEAPNAAPGVAEVMADGFVDIDLAPFIALADDPDGDAASLLDVTTTDLRGSLEPQGGDIFRFTPDSSFGPLAPAATATTSFTYRVQDGGGATGAPGTVTITVTGVNDAPAAHDDVFQVGEDDAAFSILPLANDTDIDSGDLIVLDGYDDSGLQGQLTVVGPDELSYDTQGAFEHLGPGESVTETFSYTIADSGGLTATAEVTLIINGANDAPVAVDDVVATNAFTAITIDVLANDTDADAGDTLVITDVTAVSPDGAATASIAGPQIRFTPDPAATGDYTFTYSVRDQHTSTPVDTATVTVSVSAGEAVSISAFSASRDTVIEGQTVVITWSADNANDCSLTVDELEVGSGPSGSVEQAVHAATTYDLACSNLGGSTGDSLAVGWTPALFVDDDAVGAGTGWSWEDALTSLDQIDVVAGDFPVEIRIKEGHYGATVAKGPVLRLGIGNRAVGGYDQALGGTADEPDPDGLTFLDGFNDSQTVVVAADDAALENVVIQGGRALGAQGDVMGGGVYIDGKSGFALRRCVVHNNQATSVSLTGGDDAKGGGILVLASADIVIEDCVLSGNSAIGALGVAAGPAGTVFAGGGAAGGALYVENSTGVTISNTTFENNEALAGSGNDSAGLSGDPGAAGAEARGGAVAIIDAEVTFSDCAFDGNTATAGDGGNGSAPAFWGGEGRPGGDGGPARGGALYVHAGASGRGVSISGTSFGGLAENVAIGGAGGDGGDAANGLMGGEGKGGRGGDGGQALGGAIAAEVVTLTLTDVTIDNNSIVGGDSGNGGNAYDNDPPNEYAGGDAGDGGDGRGGGVWLLNAVMTLVDGAVQNNAAAGGVAAGTPGIGTEAPPQPGAEGSDGEGRGSGVCLTDGASFTPSGTTVIEGNAPEPQVETVEP
jgi:VCBS repeat-containing protein